MESMDNYLAQLMHYCAYQERCHNDVRYKLVALGARESDIEDIISKLIQEDFLNEERFAASYVRGKFNNNGWGKLKIIQHLQQKGVSEYCILKGLKEISDDAYQSMIIELIEKKNATISKSDNNWIRKQKILRYLAQRGFETNIVYELIDNVVK